MQLQQAHPSIPNPSTPYRAASPPARPCFHFSLSPHRSRPRYNHTTTPANPRDLITLARAYQYLHGISSIDALLQTLLTAASDAVQKYCKRDFVSTAYDELYSGSGDRRLLLRQYPIISVQSVRYRHVTVIKITNTLPANVQARGERGRSAPSPFLPDI